MSEFLEFPAAFEAGVEATVAEFVRTQLPLGIYNPLQPRRARVPVTAFSVEVLDFESSEHGLVVHAGGPVTLASDGGPLEQYLRVTLRLTKDGAVAEPPEARAVYVVETGHPNGGCKETAALANAG